MLSKFKAQLVELENFPFTLNYIYGQMLELIEDVIYDAIEKDSTQLVSLRLTE